MKKKSHKFLISFLILILIITLSGCIQKSPEKSEEKQESKVDNKLEDGTYNASANGYGGKLDLEVIINNGDIKDIKILSHKETEPVFNRALPIIQDRILQSQSPIVDNVSGATISSYAIKSAVADALKKAGKDFEKISIDTEPEVIKKDLKDEHAQLVVIGGGPAGLTSAIEAKEAGVKDVILIEKMDILSGNGKFDMNFFDMINSKAQKDLGQEISKEEFLEMKKDAYDSQERKEVWANGAAELDKWLRNIGVELNYAYGETNHMAEEDEYAGDRIQIGLESRASELGVDIRTGNKGIDLIFDNDRVSGVKVETREGRYNIISDAVILATGGFSANKDLLKKYAPGAEELETSNQIGATGDFVELFDKYNLKKDNMDELVVFKLILKQNRELTGAGDGFLLVNENGERFVAEDDSGLEMGQKIKKEGKVFYIYDQRLYESFYRLKKHNDLGYHTKADSLEELAGKLGINANKLVESVNRYNEAVKGNIKDPFRKEAAEDLFEIDGPVYGAEVESAIHMTKGGVVANENAQVLDNNNDIVPGLYAAGEVTATSGAYSAAVVFGRIAGKQAASFIMN